MKARFFHCILRRSAVSLTALTFATTVVSAHATSLVINGGFDLTTTGLATGIGSNNGGNSPENDVVGWSTSGYNFVFAPGSADTTGSHTYQYSADLTLFGPGNGVENGLPATSPQGGNFVGMDGAYETSPLQQTINGLVAGDQYVVGFYWAGAQQNGVNYNSATTEQVQVSLGTETISTAIVDVAEHGFSGWEHENFTFTATSDSEVLSFLAQGTPGGEPPFALLDGVTMNAPSVPEPSSLALVLTGFAGAGGFVRSRFKKA
jgi:hypothetical protein